MYIDDYYMVEDVGIMFGQVVVKVIGDCKGICCYGYLYVLFDEVLLCVVIDFLGWLGFEFYVLFMCVWIGMFDVDLLIEFFCGFVNYVGVMLYIDNLCGINVYYQFEMVFKVFGWVLCVVVEFDEWVVGQILLMKGSF